jgi:hypothetical protein
MPKGFVVFILMLSVKVKRLIKMKGERLFRKIARNFDGGGVVYHSHSMVFGVCRQTDRSYDTIR